MSAEQLGGEDEKTFGGFQVSFVARLSPKTLCPNIGGNCMALTKSLDTALKTAHPQVIDFLKALKSEVRKLHKQNIKLQAQQVSDQERISALEDELKELQSRPTVILQHFTPPDNKNS